MKDAIFACEFPKPVPVATPEWPDFDGKLFVRMLSAAERDRYEERIAEGDHANWRARLVAMAACDAEGKRLFEDADAERLGELPSNLIERLWRAANDLGKQASIEGSVKN
jgi:hypothetical protein